MTLVGWAHLHLPKLADVDVKLLFWTMNIPLIFALLLAAALGFIVGLALPRFRRHD